jgi:hypothetical protein
VTKFGVVLCRDFPATVKTPGGESTHDIVYAAVPSRVAGHLVVKGAGYSSGMSYEPATIAVLRRALDEVLCDPRFHRRKSASALEVAEHILALAAAGERDLERLKSSAFEQLTSGAERIPNRAT